MRLWFGVIGASLAVGAAVVAAQNAPAQAGAPAQQPGLTFRVEVNYVELDAVVTDKQGHFVRGLTKDDFEVVENKAPQQISAFSLVDIPFDHAERPLYRPTPVEPDVVTNEAPVDGRVYLIVLDSFHVAPAHTAQVKTQVRDFINRYLGANDLAAVVHIGTPSAGQEFTSNKSLLLASVDRFVGQGLRSAVLNTMDDAEQKAGIPGAVAEDPEEQARAALAEQSCDSIRRLSEYLAGLHGRRKAVLLWSEGIDFNTDDVIGPDDRTSGGLVHSAARDAPLVIAAERDMIATASRDNLSLYTIDPRGTAAGAGDLLMQVRGIPEGGTSPSQDLAAELRRSQQSLRLFSDSTGGLAAVSTNDFAAAFQHIVDDNSSYYVLGFYPTDAKADGKFRTVTVRVKQPGLIVRARDGYYAPTSATAAAAPPPSDPIRDLLSSPAPVAGLGLRLSSSVLKGPSGQDVVHLTVELGPGEIPFDQKDGEFTNTLDLGYAAISNIGEAKLSKRQTLELTFHQLTHDAIEAHGLRYVAEFALPPGRYQLRLAAREPLGGHLGSVFEDLEAPDFSQGRLAMSDVMLTADSAAALPTSGTAPLLSSLLPTATTTARTFAPGDVLRVGVEVYDNDLAHPHTDDLQAVVRDDHGAQVFANENTQDTRQLAAGVSDFGYATRIPLDGIAAGRYILTVTASSRLGGDPVAKEIEFEVK